jgi:hypothetical protein
VLADKSPPLCSIRGDKEGEERDRDRDDSSMMYQNVFVVLLLLDDQQ